MSAEGDSRATLAEGCRFREAYGRDRQAERLSSVLSEHYWQRARSTVRPT